MRLDIISPTFLYITGSFVFIISSLSFITISISFLTLGTVDLHPHYVVKRYAEFAVAISVLHSSFNDHSSDEMVTRNLTQLRVEMEKVIYSFIHALKVCTAYAFVLFIYFFVYSYCMKWHGFLL